MLCGGDFFSMALLDLVPSLIPPHFSVQWELWPDLYLQCLMLCPNPG